MFLYICPDNFRFSKVLFFLISGFNLFYKCIRPDLVGTDTKIDL